MQEPAIAVKNLDKRFGEIHAVNHVSFDVEQGEIFSLLGPNGAGKSTTISMISGLLAPDEGDAIILGNSITENAAAAKACTGVVPQEIALYEDLTARENLEFWGKMYGLRGPELKGRVDEVLAMIGLIDRQKDRIEKYSGGMKRRVNIGVALLHKPKVIIMDEPTVGIDPQARSKILDVVRSIAAAGTTMLYTTHYLEEAEVLCDRIGIMDHGKILAEGSLEELTRLLGAGELLTVRGSFDQDAIRSRLADINGVEIVDAEPGHLILAAPGGGRGAVTVLGQVLNGDLGVDAVSIQPPSLNSLFLKLTGRELRE